MRNDDTFVLCEETFRVKHFPKLYNIFQKDPEWAAAQVRSIADAWHEGSVSSAAVALESDLQHG